MLSPLPGGPPLRASSVGPFARLFGAGGRLGADYVVSSSSETPFSPPALDAVARTPECE
jgi:hypothetical protein